MDTSTIKPTTKYWVFLLAIIFLLFLVIFASFTASWFALSPEEQALVEKFARKLFPYPLMGAIILCLIIGSLVSLLFRHYIIPILQLSEETKLISVANPNYRIKPKGAREVVKLIEVINETADAYQKLQQEVRAEVDKARAELQAERNRLAALMSELPNGVLVCNTDGQILLYNARAQDLLQQPGKLVGLGRSVFSVLEREPILHALDVLHHAARNGQKSPKTNFIMTVRENLSLRVNMAPVFANGNGDRHMTGFVLALEDMTSQLEAELERDMVFRTLTEAMRFSTDEIRQAISTILSRPNLDAGQLFELRQVIDRASQALEEQLKHARSAYARHLSSRSRTDDILASDLLELLKRHLRRQLRRPVAMQAEQEIWLKTDSYSLLQGIGQLANRLAEQQGLAEIALELKGRGDNRAVLAIHWKGCALELKELHRWQRRPLIRDARDQLISVLDLVQKWDGQITPRLNADNLCEGIDISLRRGEPEERFETLEGPEHRPVYYEFNLFQRHGWEELGQVALRNLTYVVFDTETTGLNPSKGDEIIQIGGVRVIGTRILYDETIDQLVDPQRHVPPESVAIHHIQPEMLRGQPTIDKVLPNFHHFCEGSVLVAHNAAFDMRFLQMKEELTGLRFDHPVLDTLLLSWVVHPNQENHNLDDIARRLDIPIVGRHTALGDALVTAEVLVRLIPLLEARGIHTLEEALIASAASPYNRIKF
ncbi:DNA polymerase-3 subunit epsilon [Geothermobacter ehrlichii]|uniref:DNA polymerase-3 subunit epsilon n=1 Tax=Geothermobacter ehrlichii TaxID=213224 RepID=A0A5D3WKS5_9BACT|nr:exonuclease domain-containing protein [Geothermobacter ehrlichii]TYO99002.1 DNA polymerase-3 subunit epsilon [Geothermobacter ehrlichii]